MSRRPRHALRIAVVCYPSLGGSGVIASALAAGLARRGHELHLISTAPPSRPEALEPRVRFHPVIVTEYPLYEHSNYTVAVAAAIVEVVRSHRIDVLHLHYAVPHAASALLARAVLGPSMPRTIMTLHGTDVTRAPEDPSARVVTRFAVETADLITVPSAFLRQAAHEALGLAPERSVRVAPNFVDVERFRPSPAPSPRSPGAPLQLVHVSNLRPVKRPLDLISVLERVRRSRPARLRVVGDGPGLAVLEEAVKERGLSGDVELLGRVADPAAVLARADVFLLPSASESFGVAALEAMALGVPVVAYQVGGLPEVVTPETGRLVPAFDQDAMAEAVLALTEDPTRHLRLCEAARARAVTEFGSEPAFDRFEALLAELREPKP